MFRDMVQELAPVLASALTSSKQSLWSEDEEEAKRAGRLVKRVAKFDGTKSRAITPWLSYLKRFFDEYEIFSERRQVLVVLECLQGEAGDYIGGCS